VLWGIAVVTAFLTATYMFRLLYMTFYGERRTAAPHGAHGHDAPAHGHAHGAPSHGAPAHGHGLHDAPAPMAIALVLLALGSGGAGLFGIPAVLRGNNAIEHFLAPSFRAIGAPEVVETAFENHGLEFGLMIFSVLVAAAGIAVASMIWLKNPQIAANMAARFKGLHTLLYNKYFVDEAYDATLVQPIKKTSAGFLWRGVDAGLIDGTVNGVGLVVRGWSAVLRRMQTGSVRAYAMSLFTGVVVIVGYYLWR